VLNGISCPAAANSWHLAISRCRNVVPPGSNPGRGTASGAESGGNPLTTSARCRSHQRAFAIVSCGRPSSRALEGNGARRADGLTTAKSTSANSSAIKATVRVPTASINSTDLPATDITVHSDPPNLTCSPTVSPAGRDTVTTAHPPSR